MRIFLIIMGAVAGLPVIAGIAQIYAAVVVVDAAARRQRAILVPAAVGIILTTAARPSAS